MADCPACGSILKYDIPSGKVICTSCNNSYMPEEVDSTQMAEEISLMGVNEFLCPNCGGEIFSTDRDITGVCAYCGSGVIFESRLVQKKKPDLILPFQKTKEDCKKIYLEHMKHKHFVPKEWKDPAYIEGFRGIYMPYWVSEVTQKGDIRYYAEEVSSKHSYQVTDTYRVTGGLDCTYHGLYHDAGSGFSDDISEKLEPFYIVEPEEKTVSTLRPFYPSYLSGFYSEPSDVESQQYEGYFLDITDRHAEEYLQHHDVLDRAQAKNVGYDQYSRLDLLEPGEDYLEKCHRVLDKNGKVTDKKLLKELQKINSSQKQRDIPADEKAKKKDGITSGEKYGFVTEQVSRLAMFPVWFMSWRRGERVAYLTVNGQTGRVVADLPIDLKQFFKIFAIWFAVCFAAFSLITIRSYAMPVYAVWFAALTLHMVYAELRVLLEHSQPEVVHKKRDSHLGSAGIGISGIVVMLIFVIGSAVIQRYMNELNFLGSHAVLSVFAFLGMTYALGGTVFSLKIWFTLKGKEKTKPVFLVSTVSALFGAFLVFSGTPSDKLMYTGACAVFACVVITMLSVILQFNKVATRPLPQFEHQGGDDRA